MLPGPASAVLLALAFDELEYGAVSLEGVDIRLERAGGEVQRLTVKVRGLRLGGEAFADIRLRCDVELAGRKLFCERGTARLEHTWFGLISARLNLRYDFHGGLEYLAISDGRFAGGRLDATVQNTGSGWRLEADLEALDLALLARLPLAGIPTASLQGNVSGRIRAEGWPLRHMEGSLGLDGLNYSADSVIQEVSADTEFSVDRSARNWQGEIDLRLNEGELYIMPPVVMVDNPPGIYLAVEHEPITVAAVFGYAADESTLAVQDLDYRHPEVLQFNLAGRLQLFPDFSVDGLSLRTADTPLERAYPVYLEPWLLNTAYNDLQVKGQAALEVGIDAEGLRALAVKLDGIDIVDGQERFAIRRLVTDIQMTEARRHASRVEWDSIDVYRIGMGTGSIDLVSDNLDIAVTRWEDLPLLDGVLQIHELDLRGMGTTDFELHMAGAVNEVSLPVLTAVLDWPELAGTLGGDFSGLHYRDGDIRMDGQLRVRMFDGEVDIANLLVRDLFGSVPELAADLTVRDIDLEQLTDTFAFGRITGRLGGHVHGLQLENWRPVAFDARLSTLDDGDTRHRISQKALNNLTQIGGGLSGALSRGFLAYFDEYSYGELGVSCRLANGFCELGGVEQYEGGHYLLTRGGLLPPWVEVKLAGSMISWEALIAGFERIARGEVEFE